MSRSARIVTSFVALAAAMALAGCTSKGASFAEKLFPYARGLFVSAEPPPISPLPTRAQLDEIPYPLISIYRANEPRRAFVIPVADLDGYVVYQDPNRRAVVLRGGQIAATQGFGFNLSGVTHQKDDPIVWPAPVSAWPQTVVRNYQFASMDAEDYEITVTCTYAPVVREQVEIVEIAYDLVRVQENCTNARRSFANTYWADAQTGFIWKSEQWFGPRRTPLIIEIIRPFRRS